MLNSKDWWKKNRCTKDMKNNSCRWTWLSIKSTDSNNRKRQNRKGFSNSNKKRKRHNNKRSKLLNNKMKTWKNLISTCRKDSILKQSFQRSPKMPKSKDSWRRNRCTRDTKDNLWRWIWPRIKSIVKNNKRKKHNKGKDSKNRGKKLKKKEKRHSRSR